MNSIPFRQGNDYTLILVTGRDADSYNVDRFRNIIEKSITNSIIHYIANNSEDGSTLFPGSVDINLSNINGILKENNVRSNRIIVAGLGDAGRAAFAIANSLSSPHMILIDPSPAYLGNDKDKKEIGDRVFNNLLNNYHQHYASLSLLLLNTDSSTTKYRDLALSCSNVRAFVYDWDIPVRKDQLLSYYTPIFTTIVNCINYGFTIPESKVLNSLHTAHQPATSSETIAEISSVFVKDNRAIIRGNAQILGTRAERYGRQSTRLLLEQNGKSHPFSLGPIKADTLSFDKWRVEEVDYSVSAFATFGGLGLDFSSLPLGQFNFVIDVTNGSINKKVYPACTAGSLPVSMTHNNVLSTIRSSSSIGGGIDMIRQDIDEIQSSFIDSDDYDLFIIDNKLNINLKSYALSSFDLVSNCTLLLQGPKNILMESSKVDKGPNIEFDLDRGFAPGTYAISLVSNLESTPNLLKLNESIEVTGTIPKFLYSDSAIGRQLLDFFRSSSYASGKITMQLKSSEELSQSTNSTGDKSPVIFDVLDLAVASVLLAKPDLVVSFENIFSNATNPRGSDFFIMSKNEFQNEIIKIHEICDQPDRDILMVCTQLPSEGELADGTRYHYPNELIKEINDEISEIEKSIMKIHGNLRVVRPWTRAVRAKRQLAGTPTAVYYEDVFYQRLESLLLSKLVLPSTSKALRRNIELKDMN